MTPGSRPPRFSGRGPIRHAQGPLPALLLAVAAALAAGAAGPAPARAQEAAADTSTVARARGLTEAGEYGAAAELLEGYLEDHPGQARVRWLYARTLYWDGRIERAEEAYERALTALPEVPELRVEYGRFLVEIGRPGRARGVLAPALSRARRAGRPAAGAEARELLSRAARATAPSVTLGTGYRDDSQPLRDAGVDLEVGVPLGPRTAVTFRGEARQLDAGTGDWRRVAGGELGLEVDWPGPARTRAAAGRLRHGGGDRAGWTGEAELALDLGRDVTLAGSGERWNYRYTLASLDTALFVETASVRLRRERPAGWGGELGGRLDRFPDGNLVQSAHLWLLAPVWAEGGDAFRLGYAVRVADADDNTFRPVESRVPPAGGPAADGGGVYDPYYTPEEVLAHSAVAALLVRPSPAVLLALDGAVGIHATETAPRATAGGTDGATVEFVDRDYRPWRVSGRLRAELSPSNAVELEAGHREDAFFRVFEGSVRWTHWFTAALPGR